MLFLLQGGLYAKSLAPSLRPSAHQTASHRHTICRFPPMRADRQMYVDRIEPCIATQHSKQATTLEIS